MIQKYASYKHIIEYIIRKLMLKGFIVPETKEEGE